MEQPHKQQTAKYYMQQLLKENTKHFFKEGDCLMKIDKQEQQDAINRLKEILKPGDTIYTVVTHVSKSGMSRHIKAYALKDNQLIWLNWYIEKILGWKRADDDATKVDGCGMDMGFELVYTLSSKLFPNGYECIGKKCPANDHVNGDRNYEPHHHNDGGYAIIQKWM
jgi:hypothetical protein